MLEYIEDNWSKFKLDEEHKRHLAQYLTPFLWEAIGEVVVAARAAMKWLRGSVAKETNMTWVTPIGFPVYQYYRKMETFRILTQISGGIQLSCRELDRPTGTPHTVQQRNGIAPNFIHSLDSTHMVMSVLEADNISFAMIHDDFGTHAGHASAFNKVIRKAFHTLYTDNAPLKEWGEQVGADLDNIPAEGLYNLDNILKATYFFG